MQILHWRLLHPQTGSTFHQSPVGSPNPANTATDFSNSSSTQNTLTQQYPFLATLLSPTKKPVMETSPITIGPEYTNNNIKEPISDVQSPKMQCVHGPVIDTPRKRSAEESPRSLGNHGKETDKRGIQQKRKRTHSGIATQSETEEGFFTDATGNKYEHTSKPYLIVHLYGGESNGYTFSAYVSETAEKEAQLYPESELIPYNETYLIDCIDSEMLPHQLFAAFELEHGVNLVRHPSGIVCEIRDHRGNIDVGVTKPSKQFTRRVVLKPTTESILSDLDRIIAKSQEEFAVSRSPTQLQEDEQIGLKRMRLTNYEYSDDSAVLSLDQRLELEKRIVNGMSGPLCLDPSKNVGIIANLAQFERLKWNSKKLKKILRKHSRKRDNLEPVKFCVVTEDIHTRRGIEVETANSLETPEEIEEERDVDPPPVTSWIFQDSRRSRRRGSTLLFNFIQKSIQSGKLKRVVDTVEKSQRIKLPPIKLMDYSLSPPLSSSAEIAALSQPAEPANIRPLLSENYVTKTEEYIFETERRKHPHRTVVTIHQRNGGDNYYGELEQEALEESTEANRATVPVKPFVPPTSGQLTGSKCQFELGSSHSVGLYVKQFTDIFTEDGRRPCKITFQKTGQPGPTVLYTNSYRAQMNGNNNATTTPSSVNTAIIAPTSGAAHVAANVIIAQSGAPTPPHSSNAIIVSVPSLSQTGHPVTSTISIPVVNCSVAQAPPVNSSLNIVSVPVTTQSSSSPSQTTPPVQIVHPQPRLQPNIQMSTASQLYAAGIQAAASTSYTAPMTHQVSTPVTRFVQPHQLLTRPRIVNVNLTAQQQQHLTMTRPTATPQLIQPQQQAGIRVKQLGVTRLLVNAGGLQNSTPKPITVIQPQPQQNQSVSNSSSVNTVQTIHLNSGSIDAQHLSQPQQVQITSHPHPGNQTNNQIMIMLASPATGNALSGQNAIGLPATNSAQHTLTRQAGNVSLNLSAINLDGLIATSLQQQHQPQTYVTSTALVNNTYTIPNSIVGVSNASLNAVNIVRYSNNTGTVTLQPQVLRQNSISVMSPQHQTAILSMNPNPATGIIVNSSQTISTNPVRVQQTIRQQQPELEEITVPDLNTLLSNGIGATRAYGRAAANKVPSIDVNLNLNLNLSSTPTATLTGNSGAAQQPTMSELYSSGRQNGPSLVDVNSVFNALSEVIGPDLEQKLEHSLVQSSSQRLTSPVPTMSHKGAVMTLNDLLGSPPMSANHASSPMQSPQSPSISSILSPISPSVTTSVAYTTPRLSALLAGTPSSDSAHNMLIDTTARGGPGSGGNLFDRLISQGQTVAVPIQRTGGSRLNPIATATPSVALDHPVLAATLTQGTNPNLRHALTRPTTYRQIAPAPPPGLQPTVSTQQQQQQQLINNILGLMGSPGQANQSQPQTIRISKANQNSTGGTGTR